MGLRGGGEPAARHAADASPPLACVTSACAHVHRGGWYYPLAGPQLGEVNAEHFRQVGSTSGKRGRPAWAGGEGRGRPWRLGAVCPLERASTLPLAVPPATPTRATYHVHARARQGAVIKRYREMFNTATICAFNPMVDDFVNARQGAGRSGAGMDRCLPPCVCVCVYWWVGGWGVGGKWRAPSCVLNGWRMLRLRRFVRAMSTAAAAWSCCGCAPVAGLPPVHNPSPSPSSPPPRPWPAPRQVFPWGLQGPAPRGLRPAGSPQAGPCACVWTVCVRQTYVSFDANGVCHFMKMHV